MQNAGLMRRLAAIIYDMLLVAALLFLATIPFIALRGGEPVEVGDNTVYRAVLIIVVYGFFVGFWTRSGRTLGMQSWGLQLETASGELPSFAAASIRFFAAIVSWVPAIASAARASCTTPNPENSNSPNGASEFWQARHR
jgi:uncharacterized RDD family membrane protein YckC